MGSSRVGIGFDGFAEVFLEGEFGGRFARFMAWDLEYLEKNWGSWMEKTNIEVLAFE
jgi:hypothetical protein